MIPAIAGFPVKAGVATTILVGIAGTSRGFSLGAYGSANPTTLPLAGGNKTLSSAFIQTDYSVPTAFRIVFQESFSTDPRAWFQYVDVQDVGRLYASDAEWNPGGSGIMTWSGLPVPNAWNSAGQQKTMVFKI